MPGEDLGKAVGEEYRAIVRAREARRAAKLAARPRKPYYNPSPEQRAAGAARRTVQQDAKANRQFHRTPGSPTSWLSREHIRPGPLKRVAIAGTLGTGAGFALHRDKPSPVSKADRQRTAQDTALGAVTGAAATDVGLTAGGQAVKAKLKRDRQRLGSSAHDQKVWAAHKAKFGVHGPLTRDAPNHTRIAVHSTYPKSLPGWRAQRMLAFKNRPQVVAGALAAGALAGAGYGYHRSHVTKSAGGHLVPLDTIAKGGVGHLVRAANRAAVPVAHHQGQRVPPRKQKKPHPVLRAAQNPSAAAVRWGQSTGLIGKFAGSPYRSLNRDADRYAGLPRKRPGSRAALRVAGAPARSAVQWGQSTGLIGKSAFGVDHDIAKYAKGTWSDDKLARRKKEGAALGTTGALIGLSALAAKGAKGGISRLKPSARTVKIANHLDQATSHALVVGAGVGGVAGLNSAAVARQDAKRVKMKKGATMTMSAFGVEHADDLESEIAKGRVDQRLRRAARAAVPPKVAAAPKAAPAAGRGFASTVARGLRSPKGKLAALTVGGGVVAGGTALGIAHHRNKTNRARIGKSAFGVDHELIKGAMNLADRLAMARVTAQGAEGASHVLSVPKVAEAGKDVANAVKTAVRAPAAPGTAAHVPSLGGGKSIQITGKPSAGPSAVKPRPMPGAGAKPRPMPGPGPKPRPMPGPGVKPSTSFGSKLTNAFKASTNTTGKLVGIGAGGAAAGLGTAALVHRNNRVGKALNPLEAAGSLRTATADVGRAFGRGAATAGAKAPIRPRAMSAGLAAAKNPLETAAFHTGNATRNFGAGFSRKPPTPSVRAAGKNITAATSTNRTAFKAGSLTRQYGVPLAVAGTGAYAGTKLANRQHGIGKSAFGVDHELISKDAVNYMVGPMSARHGQRGAAYKTHLKNTMGGTAGGAGLGAGIGAGIAAARGGSPKAGAAIGALAGSFAGSQAGYTRGYFKNKHAGRFSLAEKKRKPVEKGMRWIGGGQKAAKAVKDAEKVTLAFKPIRAGVKPTGPGSMRAKMSPAAWESQSAAAKRGRVGKSAFGVDHELGKSIGYDSEQDRHRRSGVAAGVLGTGAAGMAAGAAHQARQAVRTGRKAQTAFNTASRGRELARVKAGARDAGKLVRATTVHGGRAAGLAAGAAGLAAGAGAIVHHNRNGGRSYNGWYG